MDMWNREWYARMVETICNSPCPDLSYYALCTLRFVVSPARKVECYTKGDYERMLLLDEVRVEDTIVGLETLIHFYASRGRALEYRQAIYYLLRSYDVPNNVACGALFHHRTHLAISFAEAIHALTDGYSYAMSDGETLTSLSKDGLAKLWIVLIDGREYWTTRPAYILHPIMAAARHTHGYVDHEVDPIMAAVIYGHMRAGVPFDREEYHASLRRMEAEKGF